MVHPPTEEEIYEELSHLKKNKPRGKNGILPEMLKTCGADIIEQMKGLFDSVCIEECRGVEKYYSYPHP